MMQLMGLGKGPGRPIAGDDAPPGIARAIRRVAIVEDELMVAWSLEAMLEDLGYEVAGMFANGEDALAALSRRPVDLVCMDINLGAGIDGVETARRLARERGPAILFISAYSDAATASRIRAQVPGAPLLGKPLSQASLEEAIGRFGERRH